MRDPWVVWVVIGHIMKAEASVHAQLHFSLIKEIREKQMLGIRQELMHQLSEEFRVL